MNVQCIGGKVDLYNIPTWGSNNYPFPMFDVVDMTLVRVVYHPVSDVVRITPRIVTGISTLLLEVS